MTVWLHQQGHFTWPEWADHLGTEIAAAVDTGDPDLGDTYFLHWLKALETLVAEKGLTTSDALAERKEAWDRAAQATPHGQPIVLPSGS